MRTTEQLLQRIQSLLLLSELGALLPGLILLSLESEELSARVEQYRSATRGEQPESATERAEWERRQAELKAWADSGYR